MIDTAISKTLKIFKALKTGVIDNMILTDMDECYQIFGNTFHVSSLTIDYSSNCRCILEERRSLTAMCFLLLKN